MKTIRILLATVALLLCSIVAMAEEVRVDGITYDLDLVGKTATVISCSEGYSGVMVIPEAVKYNGGKYSVTEIGFKAFSACTGLESVTIGDSVTTIGMLAFQNCTSLESVTIGNSVTAIGNGAFSGCTDLESITIPNSVTAIGEAAFSNCTGLESILVDSFNCVYDSREGCNAIIETSTNKLVQGCKNTVIPNSVTTIGSGAFLGCTGLESVTIPNSVTAIGNRAFFACTGLESVTIPNSVTAIGNRAFFACTGLTSITIPNSVTEIGSGAFLDCRGLESIVVDSFNSVYDSREGCNALIETATNKLVQDCKNTVITNSVTAIGDMAFDGCTGLTSITIPSSVTTIGELAFSGCTGLESVVVDSFNSVYDSREGCNAIIETSTNKLVQGCKNTVIPNSVTTIGEYAFSGCTGLTSITIPSSVTTIGELAFSGCTGLESILVDSFNSVYDSREGCNALIETSTNKLVQGCKNTVIPNSVTTIGDWAFSDCTGLTSITIPSSVTTIGELAFSGCTGLTSIYLMGDVPPIVNGGNFTTTQYENAVLYVPEGTLATYKAANGWKNFKNTQEFDTTDIEGIATDD